MIGVGTASALTSVVNCDVLQVGAVELPVGIVFLGPAQSCNTIDIETLFGNHFTAGIFSG